MSIRITDFVIREAILPAVTARTKEDVIRELVTSLVAAGNVKAKFDPTEGEREHDPDFRIFAGAAELRDAARISSPSSWRRSELPRTDLRQLGRGRGWRRPPLNW